ncbi:MAG: hypothetical protein Q7T91_00740 [Sulfuricurvum sp.]|nr:hypothetical protein [Sulfuricurvum sp.]
MFTTITGIIAIILAIPTFGISIIVWIYMKYSADKQMAKGIYEHVFYDYINAAIVKQILDGHYYELRHINNAVLTLLFDMYGGKILTNNGNMVSGILPYPPKNVVVFITLEQQVNNVLGIEVHSFDRI